MNVEDELDKKLDEIKNTDKIVIAQYITEIVVNHCVSTVAVLIVHALVPKDTLSRNKKAQLYIATWALSNQIADNASTWAAANVGKKLAFARKVVNALKNVEDPVWVEATTVPEQPKTEE